MSGHNWTHGKKHPDKHSLKFWTFTVILTWHAVIPFFHRTLWLMMLYYQTKPGCKRTNSLEDTTEIVIFWLQKPHCDLDIEHSNFFFMSLWLMTLHNHTRFGNKIFCGSEVILWKFTTILNLSCDLDLEHSNHIFPQDTLASDAVLSNQVWLQNGPAVQKI